MERIAEFGAEDFRAKIAEEDPEDRAWRLETARTAAAHLAAWIAALEAMAPPASDRPCS